MAITLNKEDAVIAVDLQNDFCPGGALGVDEGNQTVHVMNRWIDHAESSDAPVVISRDWHPSNHCSFKPQGGPWPVHCVQGTPGAAFHPALHFPPEAILISKATDPDREAYSDFDGTGLADRLRTMGVKRLWIGGLVTEFCVRATALDGIRESFQVHLILPGIRPVNLEPGDGEKAVAEIEQAGGILEHAADPRE